MNKTARKPPPLLRIIFTLCCLFCLLSPGVYCQETKTTGDVDREFEFVEDEFDENAVSIADPFAPVNRFLFQFNDRLYFWVLKPVAKGYGKVVPHMARSGIKNFFYNIRVPIRLVGSLLQLKGEKAMAEYSRFVLNSTIGVLGFGNPAKKYPVLNPPEEDTGQTLAHYGIGNGFYLVLPLLGPSSLRDAVGTIGDGLYLDPVSYVKPTSAYLEIKSVEVINSTSLRIGDYETLKNSALQPYEAFRDAYIQYRNNLISN